MYVKNYDLESHHFIELIKKYINFQREHLIIISYIIFFVKFYRYQMETGCHPVKKFANYLDIQGVSIVLDTF